MTRTYSILPVTKIMALAFILLACGKEPDQNLFTAQISASEVPTKQYSYLALGDSYTVGESVPANKSFPAQLAKRLKKDLSAKIVLDIVATTGWRTDNLLNALTGKSHSPSFDFVTLLIGVNNQYQGSLFAQYEDEFPRLLHEALTFAGNDPSRVVVVSIPDYGYTPFGQNRDIGQISSEIDTYNAFAKTTSEAADVQFINITDLTRRGLEEPNLVASDGLHPSADAYEIFATRIIPFMLARLKD